MKLLFVDTECNSLDTRFGFIQELAWGLYDSDTKRLLKSASYILRWNMQYEVEHGALAVTGLSRAFCEVNGKPAPQVLSEFLIDLADSDAICGHNIIEYDRKMLTSNLTRGLFASNADSIINSKFVFDTMFDLPIENPRQIMGLKYLALDHGYILSDAHQAMADVFACAAVFFKYPFDTVKAIASTPLVTVRGHTDYHDQEGREAFYRQRFKWNRELRCWERKCRGYWIPGTQLELKRDLWSDDGEKFPWTTDEKDTVSNGLFNNEIPF